MSWNCHALLGFVRFLKCTFQFSFLTLEKEIRLGFNASLSLVLSFFFKFKSHWTWPTWRQPFDGRLNLILKLMMTKLSTVAVISPFWSAVEWGRNVFFIFTGFSFYASDGGGPSATALEHPLDSHRNSIRWSTGGFEFSLFFVCVCVCCPSGPAWNAIMKKLICNHKQRDGSVCSATTIIHGVPGFVFSSAPSAP